MRKNKYEILRILFGRSRNIALLCFCNQQRYKDSIIVIHSK